MTELSPVQLSFDRAQLSYDQACAVQLTACQKAIAQLLQVRDQFAEVADIACGTGESTKALAKAIGYQHFVALDFAAKLLTKCSSKLPSDISCVLANFQQLPFLQQNFDLIFCNMGLQWASNLAEAIIGIGNALVADGLFAFTMPVDGNFPELKKQYKLDLPQPEQLENYLAAANLQVVAKEHYVDCQQFTSVYHALRSVKDVGANCNPMAAAGSTTGLSRRHLQEMFTITAQPQTLTYQMAIYIARKIKS